MKDRKTMKFLALRAQTQSYLPAVGHIGEKAKDTKNCAIKREIMEKVEE